MGDTRERILQTALRLFAADGYEAVSVSAIAGALGMTKGALYKHFESKRAIFDSIVQRMAQIDAQRAQAAGVPEAPQPQSPQAYARVLPAQVRQFTLGQFRFWAQDPFAAAFRRLLTLEQYRNAEMARLYRDHLGAGPAAYMADIFAALQQAGTMGPGDPQLLALEFYGPYCLLLHMAEQACTPARAEALLAAHIDRFFETHAGASALPPPAQRRDTP